MSNETDKGDGPEKDEPKKEKKMAHVNYAGADEHMQKLWNDKRYTCTLYMLATGRTNKSAVGTKSNCNPEIAAKHLCGLLPESSENRKTLMKKFDLSEESVKHVISNPLESRF